MSRIGWIRLPARNLSDKSLGGIAVAVLCVGYLLNPFFGIDILPDQLPIIGNLDEAGITYVLMTIMTKRGWITVPQKQIAAQN